MSSGDDSNSLAAAARRRGSFLQTMKAVAWSFLGIRRGADYDKDIQQLNPVHVIIAGILAALLFIAALVMVVNWVSSSSTPGL